MFSPSQPASTLRPSLKKQASLTDESYPTPKAVSWKPSTEATSSSGAATSTRRSRQIAEGHVTVQSPDVASRSSHTALGLAMEDLLKPTISIKPYPSNLLSKSVQLQPLLLLPRECLSLAYIDLTAPYGELPASRFFESRIRIMELESRLGSNVLVARSESSKRTAYAIERHTNGHYVVCRLGDWVQMSDLAQEATVCCMERITTAISVSKPLAVTEKPHVPTLQVPQLGKTSTRKRQAIEDLQSLCRKRPRSPSAAGASSQELRAPACHLPTPVDDGSHGTCASSNATTIQRSEPDSGDVPRLWNSDSQAAGLPPVTDAPQTAKEIFDNIRNYYLEALYHSKGNLAYFPKGPLSRARAAFNLNIDGVLDMIDLIDFLKSLILTTVSIDKKYLSTIPNMLEQMTRQVESSDDGGDKLKKKKTKKTKLAKDGLYSNEDQDVKKWWVVTKPELMDDETSVGPQHMRYHISCLRRRETLLQMILIMEILALEAAQPQENPDIVQLPGLEPNSVVMLAETRGQKKKRSKHNYPVLLDVHADRLCIWESITLDDVKALAESHSRADETENSDKPLKDFCVDIIVPFFSARLPEVCDGLNRKLGGPVKQPPGKQRREKLANASSTNVKTGSKPGSTTKRVGAGKSAASKSSARSLERVLSNDKLRRSVSRGPSDALAHLRHATIAHVPGLKREGSESRSFSDSRSLSVSRSFSDTRSLRDAVETLQDSPVPASGSPFNKSAPKLMHSRSASFNDPEDARAKKKALVDTELQHAISALKKPNRLLAGKVMVEETERRLFGGPTYVSNTRKLVESPINSVQVKATPANTRFKDVLDGEDEGTLQYGKGFKLARGRPATQPTAVMLSVLEEPTRVNSTAHVASTPMPAHAHGGGKHRDAVPNSSPIQARKTAPRPQIQQRPQWWQKTESQPAALARDFLQLPGSADFVPASSPHQPASFTSGRTAENDDPLVTAIATTPSGKSRTSMTAQRQNHQAGSLLETPVKRAHNKPVEESPHARQPALLARGPILDKPTNHDAADLMISISPAGETTPVGATRNIEVAVPTNAWGSMKPKTIYQQLGWDDDLDELL